MESVRDYISHNSERAMRFMVAGGAALAMVGEAQASVTVANQGHCGPRQGYGLTGNAGGAAIFKDGVLVKFNTSNGHDGGAVCLPQ